MSGEIFDVKITITDFEGQNYELGYATKVSIKRNRDTSTVSTFSGDINSINSTQRGGEISLEAVSWNKSVQEATNFENMLKKGMVKSMVISGSSYTYSGEVYKRTITAINCVVTTDEDEFSPSDGVTSKLDFSANEIIKEFN